MLWLVDRQVQHVTDPRMLRAIAHPARARLMYELHARGPARAADLAPVLGLPANSVSFHLRQLAKYGLIEPDSGHGGDRRDRWWRVVAEGGTTWTSSDLESQPGGAAALRVWRRHTRDWVHAFVDAFFSEPGDRDKGTLRTNNDVPMRLTKEEAEQASEELYQLLVRWGDRGRESDDSQDEQRRTYIALTFLQPYPDGLASVPE